MKVTMMLADYVNVAEGKLNVLGGGWSVCGPGLVQMGIGIKIECPWDQSGSHHFQIELMDQDGEAVFLPGPDGVNQAVVVDGTFEAPRPEDLAPGTPIDVVIPIFLGIIPVPPGGRYVWAMTIDGETDEGWRVAFTTRPDE